MNTFVEEHFMKELNEHAGIVHRICRIYFPDTDDRKDVFQEIVFQLWKSYPSFRGQSRFSTWMYRVALNTAIAHIRTHSKTIAVESLHDDHWGSAISPEQDDEQMNLLYAAINTLSIVDKAIILLHLDENNYDEIATITGLTKSNVSVRLVRIKKKLEERIRNKKNK
ncbi:MAG: RNA polymerase subunit sigma-24 [Cytophaga sp.]|nr:RNA polymerase subunit sigma-24 [Cytophaga sp.]